ncbi:MAG: hypothetical protein R3Y59_04330 [bacterium]
MSKKLLLLLLLYTTTINVIGKKETKILWGSKVNYEVETLTTATRGTKLIKVWAFDSNVDKAIIQAKKNAISAAIFKGYPAGGSANATPPLLTDPNAEQTHHEYFNTFFATGGEYLNYVVNTSDQAPSGLNRLKVSKGYKVGIVVQVNYENLRKKLINDGIIRGLNTGF